MPRTGPGALELRSQQDRLVIVFPHQLQKELRAVIEQAMAEKARRNLMVHDAALAQQIVHHAKAIVLVGDVFRRADIDDKIEGATQAGRRFADIEVERDAVAMAVIIDRRELESERGPKWT